MGAEIFVDRRAVCFPWVGSSNFSMKDGFSGANLFRFFAYFKKNINYRCYFFIL